MATRKQRPATRATPAPVGSDERAAVGSRRRAPAARKPSPGRAASSRKGGAAPRREHADSPAASGGGRGAEAPEKSAAFGIPTEALANLQADYALRLQSLLAGSAAAQPSDRRFAAAAWRNGDVFSWGAALYELNADFLQRLADSVEGDSKTRERIRFATQQWVDAMSPANYLLTNPEVQQKLLETRGESLRRGLENLALDLTKGRISQSDEAAFEVGRNVATTPGMVVFENPLIQIIQYQPTTPRVGARPILMMPPCINKFYIMDLQPDNSLVAYTVAQGNTVFMLSWRNVDESQGQLTWDDYLRDGAIEAIRVVREISGQPTINVLGFCVGGTILATALAVLAERGERPVASVTLLTTLLDFEDPGVLGVFVDEAHASFRDSTIGKGGLMRGKELAATFSALRPNDLVWNYVVSNYLKGESPPPFDLLYWNADSTNLPGPMYCWYFRHMYLQNELRIPGRLSCVGSAIDLRRIGVPTYIYASREDHIVPWRSAYASTRLLTGELRFVLGASGHIAGVINPPAKRRRNYWSGESLTPTADAWLSGATERAGSWWPDWSGWLARFSGAEVDAPARPGNAVYRPIEPAPGRYVKKRAD